MTGNTRYSLRVRKQSKPSTPSSWTGSKKPSNRIANDVPALPTELLVMILEHCDWATIIKFRRVNKFCKALTETTSMQHATFGRLPQNVMVKVLLSIAETAEDQRLDYHDLPGYANVVMFESLNSTYRQLLQNHSALAPILFRGGRVYTTLSDSGFDASDVKVHPILQCLSCSIYAESLDDINVYRDLESTTYDRLPDLPAINDFATYPVTSKLWLSWYNLRTGDDKPVKVSDKEGVKIRDVMEAYCALTDSKAEDDHYHRFAYGGMEFYGEVHQGCPVLCPHHDS